MSPTPDSTLDEPQQVIAELQRALAERTAERDEAESQKAAMAEVLEVINASPGDLAPVFDAILEKAMRLCEAAFGVLRVYDGNDFRPGAMRGLPPRYAAYLATTSDQHAGSQRALRGENVIRMIDMMEEERYRAGHPSPRALVDLGGARSAVVVALRKNSAFLGTITIYRQEVRPFTDKQIALLQNFAAQAVIAMENARLITETSEALEQQTATADVLQVINSSPGDLAPVFDAMLEKAHSLCGVAFGTLMVRDGARFRAVALHGVPEAFAEVLRQGFEPHTDSPIGRLLQGDHLFHIPDVAELATKDPVSLASVGLGGVRTLLMVPLRKDDSLLGVITAFHQEVRPFSDKQIALLQNFAAQAVIAMENARLITETREALEQQTATAEVLGVINSSPGDLAPVFDAMLEKTLRLCEAAHGNFLTYDGEVFHRAAFRGEPQL
jgi:GAF domain-containing protein